MIMTILRIRILKIIIWWYFSSRVRASSILSTNVVLLIRVTVLTHVVFFNPCYLVNFCGPQDFLSNCILHFIFFISPYLACDLFYLTISNSMWSPSSPGAAKDMGRVENKDVALLNINFDFFHNHNHCHFYIGLIEIVIFGVPGRSNVGWSVGEGHSKKTLLKCLNQCNMAVWISFAFTLSGCFQFWRILFKSSSAWIRVWREAYFNSSGKNENLFV